MGELLRAVAYIAEREDEGTVNYTTLQADLLKPMANKSALQELGLFSQAILYNTDNYVHTALVQVKISTATLKTE